MPLQPVRSACSTELQHHLAGGVLQLQLDLIAAGQVSVRQASDTSTRMSHSTMRSGGQAMTGALVSRIITLKVQALVLVKRSTAVQRRCADRG